MLLPDPLWVEPGRKRMIQPELSARCTVLCAGRTTIKKEFLVPGDRLKGVIKKEIKVKKKMTTFLSQTASQKR